MKIKDIVNFNKNKNNSSLNALKVTFNDMVPLDTAVEEIYDDLIAELESTPSLTQATSDAPLDKDQFLDEIVQFYSNGNGPIELFRFNDFLKGFAPEVISNEYFLKVRKVPTGLLIESNDRSRYVTILDSQLSLNLIKNKYVSFIGAVSNFSGGSAYVLSPMYLVTLFLMVNYSSNALYRILGQWFAESGMVTRSSSSTNLDYLSDLANKLKQKNGGGTE